MRIWSLHPKYLDSKGLIALWRETLLAKKVLEGKTRGYKNHSQLIRFKESKNPLQCINIYLKDVYEEAIKRNYKFDKTKFKTVSKNCSITVSNDQLIYEQKHLLEKLKIRDNILFNKYKNLVNLETNSIFKIVEGPIEKWEKVKKYEI